MGEVEKERYHQLATQVPTVSDTPGLSNPYDTWHETQRVLSNLQGNVSSLLFTLCIDHNCMIP